MRITDWTLQEQQDTVEVSADVDGFRLWYRVPRTCQVSRAGDPFLASALILAMLKGEELEIDPSLPVSPKFLENVSLIQDIHHSWNPVLKKIPIRAKTAPVEPLNSGGISFFSGGVDSLYTFLKRPKDISHVVFLHGFDFFRTSDDYGAAVARNSAFVAGFGKTLIPVETNHYPFDYRNSLSRILTQGSTLASVALLLGFPRAYVPSSMSYDLLYPSASHPLLDPLYSNESVDIIHDGAEALRTEKLIKIAECESAMANLVVCIDEMNFNCGQCMKCLRTMTALEILGAKAALFPPFPPAKTIRRRYREVYQDYLKENLELAVRKGHEELAGALKAIQRRYDRKQLIKDADRVLLGGLIKRTYRKIRKEPRRLVDWIDVVPPKN
jgi:hypothetical protein